MRSGVEIGALIIAAWKPADNTTVYVRKLIYVVLSTD